MPKSLISIDELLVNNLKEECLRMMLVNYSLVLIGMGKNDKISIYNDPVLSADPGVKEFFEKQKDQIVQLKRLRDKFYSHVDPNPWDSLIFMPLDFIKKLILFATKAIGIENPKVKPK